MELHVTGLTFAGKSYVTLSRANQTKGENGKVVKIDKSKLGKRPYHWGHYVKGQWVFVAQRGVADPHC